MGTSVATFLQGPVPSVLATHRPPMNGTIAHSDNEQHILLEFSNSQHSTVPVHTRHCNGCAAGYYLGPTLRCVWSAHCAPPLFLGLVWVPNPGKSVGPGVTQWAGLAHNLLLLSSDSSVNWQINSQWTLNNQNPLIWSVSFLLTSAGRRNFQWCT